MQKTVSYFVALALTAARNVWLTTEQRLNSPRALRRQTEKLERHLAARRVARSLKPNVCGNYPGKRTPKPEPIPLTAVERLHRLAATFLERRMTYRNGPSLRETPLAFRKWLRSFRDRHRGPVPA